ncbi:MAG: dienelactone hydrolase family protein [Betaproteobacteria bacterium]|nr:dienelactone hydrolase family protein [Betaproteobacteria bacterium]
MRNPDFINFEPKTRFTRREFVMTSVAASTQITTDSRGLTAGEVKIAAKDGEIPAYRAMPAGGKNLPTVLVVHEIFGVHEHIKDVCRRFAKAGYLAIAPEMFARQGDLSKLDDIDQIRPIVAKVTDAQVMSDLDAAAGWAAKHGGNPAKLAITGFCWGGRVTWLYAAHNQDVMAGVAWYGRVVGQASELSPKHPIDLVSDINAPVLGLYGGADGGIPNDTVDKMRAALKAAGKKSEIHTYPGMPHAFHADYRPSYRKEAADDGWKRLLDWFRKHGVA